MTSELSTHPAGGPYYCADPRPSGQSTSARRLRPQRKLGEGGQGSVYQIQDRPGYVAKIYHPLRRTPEATLKLVAMINHPPTALTPSRGHQAVAWPIDLISDSAGYRSPEAAVQDIRSYCGFVMPAFDHTSHFPLFKLYHPRDRIETAPQFNWASLMRVACNLASVVAALHAQAYIVGDLNESNIFVSQVGQVTVLDCDSMQVRDEHGRLFRCTVGKPEYLAPELQGKDLHSITRGAGQDDFSLAILIFLLLMEGRHPFSGVWYGVGEPPTLAEHIARGECAYVGARNFTVAPKSLAFNTLPPQIQGLMRRCFSAGLSDPLQRPTASEWQYALAVSASPQNLKRCTIPSHYYSTHLSSCPWCERKRMGISDPFVIQ